MAAQGEGDPFIDGRDAAKRGEAGDKNPHPPTSDAHELWAKGHASIGLPEDLSEELGRIA